MTRITGSQILKAPCCGRTMTSPAYASINFSVNESWTDGQAVGTLFNKNGQLRKCLCGQPFFLSDAMTGVVIKYDDPVLSVESIPSAPYIKDDEVEVLLSFEGLTTEIEIALRQRLWRISNDSFRHEYREHMESNPSDLPRYNLSPEQANNLNALKFLLLNCGNENVILMAEIERTLGNFEAALELLNAAPKNDAKLAQMLKSLVKSNYTGPARYRDG